jgi:hypothetical protein
VDGSQFDALTRRVMTEVHRRRAALKTAMAAAVAGLLGHGAIEEAEAKPRCTGAADCNSTCAGTTKACACIEKAGGRRTCVHPCCSNRACQTNDNCRDTEVCLRTRCCGDQSVCVTKCTKARPTYCDEGIVPSSGAGASWGP